jgi:leucyl-tRNA synthetase
MSRSGDECVVALTDQWYLTYGEDEWRDATLRALEGMEAYNEDARHAFQ